MIILSVVILISNLQLSTQVQNTCPVTTSYTGRFNETDHETDKGLAEGYVIKVSTAQNAQHCFGQCVTDCRCVSYQISGKRCELLNNDKSTAASGDFKPKPGYKYFELKHTFKQQSAGGCCFNGCCRYDPCNGGTCVEKCIDAKSKVSCTCLSGYAGKNCHIPPSCDKLPKGSPSGIYTILKAPSERVKVYCDLSSEPGFVWTLIESVAYDSTIRSLYLQKPFYVDFPRNEIAPIWTDYRLSLTNMQHVDIYSTHWRATCMFDSEGLNYADYLRVNKSSQQLLQQIPQRCIRYEYISVRNISCSNCTGYFRNDVYHAFGDSTAGKISLSPPCEWDGTLGAKITGNVDIGQDGEENFGVYEVSNPLHKCSSSNLATTNYWLGKKIN